MENKKVQLIPIFVSAIASVLVFLASSLFREATFKGQMLLWIGLISLPIVAILMLYLGVVQWIPRLEKKSVWLTTIPTAILIYLGVLMCCLPFYKDLLIDMSWVGITSLGLAVITFGFRLLPRNEKPQISKTTETLDKKMETLNKKLDNVEKTIDAFLDGSQKLGKKLTTIQKEHKGKGK